MVVAVPVPVRLLARELAVRQLEPHHLPRLVAQHGGSLRLRRDPRRVLLVRRPARVVVVVREPALARVSRELQLPLLARARVGEETGDERAGGK